MDEPRRKVTPRSLVLDLLRVVPADRVVLVRDLVEVGRLFGLSEGSLRVAIARSTAAGELESDERGAYRLSAVMRSSTRLVDRWRLGDGRTRPWDGGWLVAWQPSSESRARRRHSLRALEVLGFRQALRPLFVRPDNLDWTVREVERQLRDLGLADGAEVLVGSQLSTGLRSAWARDLWPKAAIGRRCRESARAIERSVRRMSRMPNEQALVETFVLGGEAIRILAFDPLLPDEILDGTDRRRLHEVMTEYDALGRALWRDHLSSKLRRAVASPADEAPQQAAQEPEYYKC